MTTVYINSDDGQVIAIERDKATRLKLETALAKVNMPYFIVEYSL